MSFEVFIPAWSNGGDFLTDTFLKSQLKDEDDDSTE